MIVSDKKREQLRAADRRFRMKRRIEKYGIIALTEKFAGKHGNHARGDRSGKWKGGRVVTKDGYISIRVGTKYKLEHRVIAEMLTGRKLGKRDAVHHIDGNKQNNIPENLEVTTWGLHRKYHDKFRDVYGRFPSAVSHFPPRRDGNGRYVPGRIK